MTRRDYVLLAEVVRERVDNSTLISGSPSTVLAELAEYLAERLWSENKSFDRDRFLEDCGVI